MDVIIVGAGTLAQLTAAILSHDHNIRVAGLIDVEKPEKDKRILGLPVIGDHSILGSLIDQGIRGAIVAVGDNYIREAHYYALSNMGYELVNAVHPTALIAPDVTLGQGVVVAEGCILATGVSVGNNVLVGSGSVLSVRVEVGENVNIGPRVCLGGACTVKRNSHIGIGVSVASYLTIGKNAIVPVGAAILENVADRTLDKISTSD
jgi:UDP-perosamine 4-acetyltransferase